MRSICGPQIPVLLVACKTDLRDKAAKSGRLNPDAFIDEQVVRMPIQSC